MDFALDDFALEDFFKIILAVVAGGLVGAEREFRDKAAGLRTIIFICVGATLFTIFSLKIGAPGESARIAANIVSGIGFLGAGVIIRYRGRILGLTTASTIWLAAALGMGIGAGYYLFSASAVGVVLIVLWVFPQLEHWMGHIRETHIFDVTCLMKPDKPEQLAVLFRQCGLKVKSSKQAKAIDQMICTFEATGSPKNHEKLVKLIMSDPEVTELRF